MSDELSGEPRNRFNERKSQFEETNARIEKRAGRNLPVALFSGFVFAAIFSLMLFLTKILFALFIAALITVSLLELATALRQAGLRVPRVGVALSGLIILAGAYWFGAPGMLGGFIAGAIILALWRLVETLVWRSQIPPKTLVRDVFSGLFSLAYVAVLGSFAILVVQGLNGQWWVFSLVTVVVSVDIGAYAAGVTLGKHKMTPRISPNKTWEGFAGASVLGIIVAILCSVYLLDQPWWMGVIFGLMLLATATFGDLTESLIKRNLGVKDMSSWIPGHGGFLDRLDSLLPSTVPAYVLLVVTGGA